MFTFQNQHWFPFAIFHQYLMPGAYPFTLEHFFTWLKIHHLKRPWCWERLKAGGEEDNKGWDGWMASSTQWTWVWVTLGVGDRQGGLACCGSWGHKELDMTKRLNWNDGTRCMIFNSVHSVMFESLRPHGLQHARLPCLSPTPGPCSNSSPLSRWCHPTISSSVVAFSSHLQSFPASESFQISHCFASDGQRIGVSASTSVLPKDIQDWLPLGWTAWISLQSKGLSKVLPNTTVQKHQVFGTQLSL